jgi:serine/threonine-protein kinase
MLQSGKILANRYEIINLVGSGGMAEVYKAKCHRLNRFVAIKVLKEEFGKDADFVKRFHTEAQAAASLMHPNIVSVYDVGEGDGLHYIVMELVEGITLKDYIHQKGCLSSKDTVVIATQIGLGLEAAHKNKTVHRDIKPQNIIITDYGRVKVADFGIARATGGNTITPTALGSVHYFSPEQARGGYVDCRSDIYSLGITMFEIVTGHVPFDGENAVAVALKHIQEELVFGEEEEKNISDNLKQIIKKATNKKPDHRYETMTSLLNDLKIAFDNNEAIVTAGAATTVTAGSTVVVKKKDVDKIKELSGDKTNPSNTTMTEIEYENNQHENGMFRNTKDMDPKLEKIIKILCIIVGGIFAVIFIIFLITQISRFQGGLGVGDKTEESTAGAETTTVGEEKETVIMPNLVELTWEEAMERLESNKLVAKIQEEPSDIVKEGYVIRQSVKRGDEVEVGTEILVVVSAGKGEVEIPKVVGEKETDAKKKLADAGFAISTKEEFSDTIAEGIVISQNIEGKAEYGSEIVLVISKGKEPLKQVSVPSVKGHTEAEAKSIIENAGLSVGTISHESSDRHEEGYVISQTPGSGTNVDAGTKVDIVVSNGPSVNDPSGDSSEGSGNPADSSEEQNQGQ